MKTKKFISSAQALLDANSSVNQDIKGRFIGREVYCNVNALAEYVLSKGYEDREAPFTHDDIENYYSPNLDSIIREAQDKAEDEDDFAAIKEYANNPDTYNRRMKKPADISVFLYSLDTDELQEFCDEFEIEYETEPTEIFEWWAVSEYLYDKLKEHGHPVVTAGTCYLWGRPTTGQAILLDGVISRICADMLILDGQERSWKEKK